MNTGRRSQSARDRERSAPKANLQAAFGSSRIKLSLWAAEALYL